MHDERLAGRREVELVFRSPAQRAQSRRNRERAGRDRQGCRVCLNFVRNNAYRRRRDVILGSHCARCSNYIQTLRSQIEEIAWIDLSPACSCCTMQRGLLLLFCLLFAAVVSGDDHTHTVNAHASNPLLCVARRSWCALRVPPYLLRTVRGSRWSLGVLLVHEPVFVARAAILAGERSEPCAVRSTPMAKR